MKNFKKIMSLALLLSIGTVSELLCKVTFINNLPVSVKLTGPRGSKNLAAGASGKIMPLTNPVNYSIQSNNYTRYDGSARNNATYIIDCDENNNITVRQQNN